jgi:hypothetical protein
MRTEWERDSAGGHLAAVELAAPEARALADAVSFYLRRRFGAAELELAAKALSLRALTGVSDRLGALAETGLGGRLMLTEQELRGAREALCLYVAERDGDAYQPPEERERLAELHAMNEPLGDLLARLPATPAAGTLLLR